MNMTNTISYNMRMWYEFLESGIFMFMKPECNNVFILYFGYEILNMDIEINLIAQEGIWDTHHLPKNYMIFFASLRRNMSSCQAQSARGILLKYRIMSAIVKPRVDIASTCWIFHHLSLHLTFPEIRN